MYKKSSTRRIGRSFSAALPVKQEPKIISWTTTNPQQGYENPSNFVFSFDKLSSNHVSPTFNPTLSLLIPARVNSNESANANVIQSKSVSNFLRKRGKSCTDTDRNLSSTQDGRLIYLGIKDRIIDRHRSFLSAAVMVLAVTSLVLSSFSLGIMIFSPETFTSHLLNNEPYQGFPFPIVLSISAILGFLECGVFIISMRFPSSKRMPLLIKASVALCLWAAFTVIYNFGSNIIFEFELENLMLQHEEMSHFPEESSLWSNSQNFFQCCGINSYGSWDWRKGYGGLVTASYPSGCCESIIESCTSDNSTIKYNLMRKPGCLKREMDAIMGISYAILIISTIHFQLMAFATLMTIKMHYRQKVLDQIDLELQLYSPLSEEETVMKKVEKEPSRINIINYDSNLHVNPSQIKRSFTL